MITLKNIVVRLEAISAAHPKINQFGFGEQTDLQAYTLQYPYFWVSTESPHRIVYSPDNKFQSIEFQFTLRVCDKVTWGTNPLSEVGEESNNGLDALSDTFQILREILNAIMMDTKSIFTDLELIDDILVDPLLHADGADVNGHEAIITLRTKNDSKCISTITD